MKNSVRKKEGQGTTLPLEACLRVAASAKAGGRERVGVKE